MSSLFSPENYGDIERLCSIIRWNDSGVDGDPALEALHWGEKIEPVIDADPENILYFVQFANDVEAAVEFQLIGILAPYLLAISPGDRGDVAHYWLDDVDTLQFDTEMKKLSTKSSNK